jgi:hypothetical protein
MSVLLFAIATLLPGCASIVSKSSNAVYIRTDPAGAQVTITDKKGNEVFKGKTPTTVTLRAGAGFFSKAEYQVRFNKQGFSEKIVPVNYRLNGWYFGNIVFGGLIGFLIVDPATGAMWKIKDPVVAESLEKEISTTLPTSSVPTLKIVDIKDLSVKLQSDLERIN